MKIKHCLLIISPQLNGSAQLTEAVQLIPLRRQRLRPSSACLTAGWGDVGDNRTIATRLQEVNVTTLSQKACLRRWKLRKVTIDRTMVCGVGAENFQGFCSVRKHPGCLLLDQAPGFCFICVFSEVYKVLETAWIESFSFVYLCHKMIQQQNNRKQITQITVKKKKAQ